MSLNILIVDDSSVVRRLIEKTLRLSGVPIDVVHQAANGVEGLGVVEKSRVDLILADIHMPMMNGDEMVERLRADPKTAGLPVIIISTDGSPARVGTLAGRGVHFVRKPFTPEMLRDRILEATEAIHGESTGIRAVPCDGPDF